MDLRLDGQAHRFLWAGRRPGGHDAPPQLLAIEP
jgi:hypothetical protein